MFREAQSAGKLSHPNIVTVYDVDEDGDTAYIAMELVEGRTLEQLLRKGPVRELALAASVLRQAAAALDYAHGRGIVHRDVKPGNLMLGPGGVVKIMDFGIARIGSSNLTQTGSVLGTPSYMSPEQVKGEELDGRSDQFSLGVVAYEMLAGQKPFPGENLTAVIYKIVSKEPPSLAAHCPDISPELEAVVMRALSKNPDDRFADCEELAEAFEGVVQSVMQGVNEPAFEAESTQALNALAAADEDASALADDAPGAKLATETSRLPPLRRRGPAVFVDQDPKKRWGSRIGAGLAAALLLGAAGYAVANPSALSDPATALAELRAWVTGTPPPAAQGPGSATGESVLKPAPSVEARPRTEPAEDEPAPAQQAPESGPQVAASPLPQAAMPPSETVAPPQTQTAAPPQTVAPARTATAKPTPVREPVKPPPTAKSEPRKAVAKVAPAKSAPAPKTVESVSVYFRTTPIGARIQVNDRSEWVCESPCQLSGFPPGKYQVKATLDGYHPAQREVSRGSSAQAVLEIKLEDARITALITSDPTGADIYIDGRKTGRRTNAKVPLPRGTYQIKVVKEGVGEAEQVMVVDKDQIPYAKFVLNQGQ